MMGEVANTHGHVGTAVWAGQPQPWVLGVWLRCEAPLALGLGSTAPECSTLVNTRSPNEHCPGAAAAVTAAPGSGVLSPL